MTYAVLLALFFAGMFLWALMESGRWRLKYDALRRERTREMLEALRRPSRPAAIRRLIDSYLAPRGIKS